MKASRSFLRSAAAAALILLLSSAGAEGFPLAAAGASFGSGGLSAFAKESLPSFSTFVLSNGLPVIVKKGKANRVEHISLAIRGGSAATSVDKAGIEALALKTMARGSGKLSYDEIQALLDETSSGLGSASSFDYSIFSLTTLDKYFDRLFPVWVDTIVDPAFRQADFDQALSEAKLALDAKEQDPWAKAGLEMNQLLFKGHPYAASPDGNRSSLASAALADVKAWYAGRMRAGSLFVVAVGDFDARRLRAKLEAGLGKLPGGSAAAVPSVPPLARAEASSLKKVEFPQSRGMGYLRGDFPAPSYSDPDYMPLSIGAKMLTDLLFSVVRDKYGAVYSAGAYVRGFNANYGSLTLFKTKNPGKAKAYIDEAIAVMASGRGVALVPQSSKDGYAPVSELLEAVKAQFVNELYESQATNAAVAGRIASSVVTTGDYRSYLLDVDRIRAVSADEVMAALDKYVLKGSIAWLALGSADVLIPAQSVDFEGFARGK